MRSNATAAHLERSLGFSIESIIASMSPSTYTSDTSPEALAVQLECMRRMTPQQRIRQTCAMSRQVKRMAFAAIRRRHPGFSEDEVQNLFIELTYGQTLANEVRRWKEEQDA